MMRRTEKERADPFKVEAAARLFLETPYVHQASCLGGGVDCLGLVRGVWRILHGREPQDFAPYARDWAETVGEERLLALAGAHLVPRDGAPQAGDVVLLRWRRTLPASHIGILGQNRVLIHAAAPVGTVAVPFRPWESRLAASFSFPLNP